MTHSVSPVPEVDQKLLSGESIDNLHSIDDADAGHAFCVIRAQQEGQLDELVPCHAQLALHILHPVLLHILLPLKNVPAGSAVMGNYCCNGSTTAVMGQRLPVKA